MINPSQQQQNSPWRGWVQKANKLTRHFPTWPLYLIGAVWAGWMFFLGVTGELGVDPIEKLEHIYGKKGLQLLVLVLAISPLKRFSGINLIKYRRTLGLLTFFSILLHLLTWLVLDVQLLDQIWQDILKRPYITIGMVGFILMTPLAITSNNYSIRRLAKRWRRLHRLTYLIALLGATHFVMLTKGFQLEPLVYLAVIVLLLLLRLPQTRTLFERKKN